MIFYVLTVFFGKEHTTKLLEKTHCNPWDIEGFPVVVVVKNSSRKANPYEVKFLMTIQWK